MAKKVKKKSKKSSGAKKAKVKKTVSRKPAKVKASKKKVIKKKIKASKKPAAVKAVPAPPSASVNTYLNFNGNCEDAFNFYRSVFGGDFSYVGRFKDMPPSAEGKELSAEAAEKIMHISLPISKETALMGSDTIEGFGPPFNAGNNFSISINAVNRDEADKLFNRLSSGGSVTMPMNNTFWGSYFGMFTDKYGIQWMVSAEPGKN